MKLRILLIGTGSVALRHLKNIVKLYPSLKEIYIYSNQKKRALWFKNFTKLKYLKIITSLKVEKNFFTNLIIASNTATHSLYIKKLHDKIKNIYCEKPIGYDANFKFLEKLSKKKDTNERIKIGFQWRLNPTIKYIKEYIKKNKKKIYQIDIDIGQNIKDWRKNSQFKKLNYSGKKKYTGVHWELCHELDILNYIIGNKFTLKSNLMISNKTKINIVDNVNSLINFNDKKIICKLSQNMLSPFLKHKIIIYSINEEVNFDLIDNKYILKNKFETKKFNIKKNFKRNDMFFNSLKNFFEKDNKSSEFRLANLKDGLIVTKQILRMEKKF